MIITITSLFQQAMDEGDKDKGGDPQPADPQVEQQEPMDQ